MLSNEVILVDEQDNPIGEMDVVLAHKNGGKLHRAISVFLISTTGEVLLQQRSSQKFTCPGLWANTCCGNVRNGETYLECANRRLKDELGIENVLLQIGPKFIYMAECNDGFVENEWDQTFWAVYDGPVSANPSEVTAYKQVPWQEWLHTIDKGDGSKYVPWVKIMFNQGVLSQIESLFKKNLKSTK